VAVFSVFKVEDDRFFVEVETVQLVYQLGKGNPLLPK
jgi:hypothetical protein